MDARNNIATDLFYKIRSRFKGLKLGAETGQITIMPEEARFFDFDYMEGEQPIGHVSISLAEPNSLKVYFSNGITEGMDDGQKDNWYGFLRELRQFAKRRLLSFDTRDIAKDNLDRRDYEFLAQNSQPKQTIQNTVQKPVGESIMAESSMYGSRLMSYQNLMDTKLIIKHNQAVMDDATPGARARNIAALFVENQDGERFKYPFIHLAGARAMQRHVANGGVPYDDVGKSIVRMSEEIAQLKSFGNYVVRNDLMNVENNAVVEQSSAYLNSLREQIKALAKQSHYEAYRENFQAYDSEEVPQDVVEDFKEKFTVRSFKEDIATVFPVLYRLMKENDTIGYDDIVAMTQEELQNEDVEIEREEYDPFAQFENWVMELGEASAITSADPDEQATALQGLQELVGQSFPAGVDGTNAIESLKGIIEDPELYKRIKDMSAEDPEADVREQLQGWLQLNAPEILEQLDFGDMAATEVPAEEPAAEVPAEPAPVAAPIESMQNSADTDNQEEAAVTFAEGDKVIYMGKHNATVVGQDGSDYFIKIDGQPGSMKVIGSQLAAPKAAQTQFKRGDVVMYKGQKVTYVRPYGSDPTQSYITSPNGSDELVATAELTTESAAKESDGAKKSDIPAYMRKSKGGDDWKVSQQDLEKEKERNISSKEWLKKQNNESLNVQELAEFITSFYDKNLGTFPKGPEGVCTMVGKKFGEQAESVARKFVERMAPQQAMEQNSELARIRELSGMPEAAVAEAQSQYYYEKLADEVFALDPDLDTSGRADDVLNAAYPLIVRDLGSKKRANNLLNYDEDFPSDFVSAYGELQRNRPKKGSDTISKMFGGSADELTKGLKIRDDVNPELESIKRLSGIGQGIGF